MDSSTIFVGLSALAWLFLVVYLINKFVLNAKLYDVYYNDRKISLLPMTRSEAKEWIKMNEYRYVKEAMSIREY